MNVLLVHGSKTKSHAYTLLRRWTDEATTVTVLEIDCRVDRNLLPSRAVARTYESFLSEDDLEMIDGTAGEFAESWYRLDDLDLSIIDGISQGAIHELDVFYTGVLLFKNVECAHHVLSENDFDRMFIGAGVSIVRWAWAATAKARGIPSTLLDLDAPVLVLDDLVDHQKHATTGKLLKLGWQLLQEVSKMAKSSLAGIPKPVCEGHATRARPALAVREGRSTCAPWFNELRQSGDFELLSLNGSLFSVSPVRLARARLRLELTWLLNKARLKRKPIFRYRGIHLWPYWSSRCHQLFVNQFALSYARSQGIVQWLKDNSIQALVVPWHNLDRLSFEVAEACGIPLIGLQDSWLPGEHFPAGYRRFMRCHHLLVWGEISAGWTRHMKGTQSHIVGNSQAPSLACLPPKEEGSHNFRPTIRVLLTHQCWGPWTAFHSPLDTNDMWDAFARAASHLPDVQFLGKIHPLVDHPNHEWPGRSEEIKEWASALGLPNFSLLPLDYGMDEALRSADLVVTYYSLTAVEALVQGIPVAMMNVTGKRDLFPELVEVCGTPAVRSAQDLIDLVRRIPQQRPCEQRWEETGAGVSELLQRIFGKPQTISHIVKSALEGKP